ncbi:MAG: hypothetical protein IKV39_05030 [Clostridia bacterium]|nr:hypothetical protein [Clostridia bacterium]
MPSSSPLKKPLILLANFALFYLLLRLIIVLSERTGMFWIYYLGTAVYGIALVGLFIGFFVLNGYTFDKKMLTREDLPDDWSEEAKTDFIKKQPEQKEKAKNLLLFLFPLIITFAISYVELYLFS